MKSAIIKLKTSSILWRYPLLKNKRSLVWQKVKGLWKTRGPNPISELNKMRQDWN